MAFKTAVEIYKLSESFLNEEKYSLTDQIRRSSCSVCANLAEAAETQVWLDFALEFGYINQEQYEKLDGKCNNLIGKLVNMANQPEKWS